MNKLSNANLEKRNQGFYGGLHPFENKDTTNEKPISSFPEPETVSILLSQHTGAICEPLVKSGDTVQFGQKIGDSNSFISAPVHSSVSGKVISIEEALHPAIQKKVKAVIIKNDFKNTQHESVKPAVNIEALSKEELVNIIREKGIVGLGGAMFPTHVKLKPPKPVDTLLINGCECEPYLTADNRVMIEHAREVISGIQILEKILGTKQTLIAIEDNKPQAVEAMKTQTGSSITVSTLPSKYPQGAEKVLIKKTLGRDVPAGKIPLDVGVVVTNVSTALSVYDAVYKGTPLIERIITISGKNCSKPGNYKVKLGTPLQNILKHCFDKPADTNTEIKMGGPMMGILQPSIETSIIKGTTGIITVDKKVVEPDTQRSCIKCGRCVDACPMELYPLFYAYCSSKNKLEDNEKYDVAACIECGSCENICSSKIALTSIIKQSKRIIASKKVS
ncbi:MAG: hypothetical protein A2252_06975 [Elusimicrobia bacterium RIFOXYA2_FULL_39_19]|nr:MAG: hypothetical protein A2252_06975 [Elusimicrobia bacterium RIFOXYA2_FULL_39_19]